MATLNQNNVDYTVRLNRESKHNRGLLRANSQVRIANRLGDVLGTNAKRLARLRRRAGKVRDIDVLTDFASTVRPKGENECSVMLLEHLGARRQKHAAKLRAAVRQKGSKLRKRLKGISTEFEKLLPEASANVAGLAVKLSTELASPAGLNKRNLHPYRLKVKELRNVLQMADNADQQEFIATLGEAKDAIGEWHDWQELTAIAGDILDHGPRCQLLRELERISEVKYQRLADALRKKYLRVPRQETGRTRGPRHPIPDKPVWHATAALAA